LNKIIKISVVLPFFNAEKTLERAIKSILNQTYVNFEFILVNNNSTDKSIEIVQKYLKLDNRIKLIHEKKQGVVFASNKGMQCAKGQFIARMDADDESLPERLEKQIEFLENNIEIDAVGTLVKYSGKYENLGLHKFVEYTNTVITPKQISDKRFSELVVINPSIMFRKSSLEKYGHYKYGDFPEDYELFLRWLSLGAKFAKLPEKLLIWYDSDERLTRTDAIYSQDSFFRLKSKYLDEFLKEKNKFYPNVVIWGAGRVSRRRAKMLEQYGIKIQFYIDVDSKKIDNIDIIHYLKIPKPGTIYILSYVNNYGAKVKIFSYLKKINK